MQQRKQQQQPQPGKKQKLKQTQVSSLQRTKPTAAVTHGAVAPLSKGQVTSKCDPVGTEDTVTLSPISSPPSPVMDHCSPSPFLMHSAPEWPERNNPVVATSPAEAAAPSLSPSAVTVVSEGSIENVGDVSTLAQTPLDMHCSEQMLYYLEVVHLLRHVGAGIEAREQFLLNELRSQTALYEEKVEELARKKASYQVLHESTLRLSRQVRGIDSDNDRMRDQLSQLHTTTEKLLSRRLPRNVHRSVLAEKTNHNHHGVTIAKGEDKNNKKNKTNQNSSSLKSPPCPVTNVLMLELDTYRKKLRIAEAKHEKFLNELQLAVARQRGRAAAYSVSSNSMSTTRHTEWVNSRSSYLAVADEDAAIQQLEHMIDKTLVSCK